MKLIKIILWIGLFPFMLLYWGLKNKKRPAMVIGTVLSLLTVVVGMTSEPDEDVKHVEDKVTSVTVQLDSPQVESNQENTTSVSSEEITHKENEKSIESLDNEVATISEPVASTSSTAKVDTSIELFEGYKLITVEGGDISGSRQSNVVVDIGFGNREYWAFTNEYGQLIRVIAKEIILQDDSTEPVTDEGRYYPDEAKVPGTEVDDLDEGHVIADSLGGVSNAYNITPQDSTMNRYGNQAYMEDSIRKAGGCTDFEAIITYPDTNTQIPNHYHFTYTLMGNVITEDFDNINPDMANASLDENTTLNNVPVTTVPIEVTDITIDHSIDLKNIDTNGNGQVTIKEAIAAGYSMPIYSDHWLYKYMDDRDHEGMVGE